MAMYQQLRHLESEKSEELRPRGRLRRMSRSAFLLVVFAFVSCGGIAQNIPTNKALDNIEKHNTRAALDTPPFYLKSPKCASQAARLSI
jgi:hypothetical protein